MTIPFDDWAPIYDAVHAHRTSDVAFYVSLAREIGGPVLELGCGTGRIAFPVAEAGIEIVGLDSSLRMLAIARRRLRKAGYASGRLTFRWGDMAGFRLGRQCNLVIVPFNSFLHLLSVADQRSALQSIHRHLPPGGRLALDIFVPDLRRLSQEDDRLYHLQDVSDPASGRRFSLSERSSHDNHHQVIHTSMTIEEFDPSGSVLQSFHLAHQVRYIHRYEMLHLLEVSGFQVEDIYGDFQRGDFDPNSEQMVWIARKV